jgi:hypothetical protein
MHCTTALAQTLRRVPGLLDDLVVTWSKQDRLTTNGGKNGKGAEQPLPVRLDIPAVIVALSNELTTWARDLVDRNGWDVPDPLPRSPHNSKHGPVFPATTATVDLACYAAEWLADHVDDLRKHPAVLEAHHAITHAINRTKEAVDLPDDRTRFPVGPCPENDDHDQPCTGQVWAHVPTNPRDPAELRCRVCDTHWDTTRWHRAGARIAARSRQLNQAAG